MVTTSATNVMEWAVGSRYSRLLDEAIVFCPGCKTLETITFSRNKLVTNRKFHQMNGHIYHNCGSMVPCRLYRMS